PRIGVRKGRETRHRSPAEPPRRWRAGSAGGGSSGLQLGTILSLALLPVRVLMAPQRLRVGELAAAVLAPVLPPVPGGA
ncbi:unnamed protein product, partial [Musa hybrid cultivar]